MLAHSQTCTTAGLTLQSPGVSAALNFALYAPHTPRPGSGFVYLLICLSSPSLEARDFPYMGLRGISLLFPIHFQCFSAFCGRLWLQENETMSVDRGLQSFWISFLGQALSFFDSFFKLVT